KVWPLGPIFLHKICVRDSLRHFKREAEPVSRSVCRKAQRGEGGPCRVDVFTQIRLRIWCRICCDHIETPRQVLCCPTGAYNSGANDGNASYRFVQSHVSFSPMPDGDLIYCCHVL